MKWLADFSQIVQFSNCSKYAAAVNMPSSYVMNNNIQNPVKVWHILVKNV